MSAPWDVFAFFAGLLLLIAGALGIRFAGRRQTGPPCPRCVPAPMCSTPRSQGCALFIAETGDE